MHSLSAFANNEFKIIVFNLHHHFFLNVIKRKTLWYKYKKNFMVCLRKDNFFCYGKNLYSNRQS